MKINIKEDRKIEGIKVGLLVARLSYWKKHYPEAVVVLNERSECLDLYLVINNGGDTEYLTQVPLEGSIWPKDYQP